MDAWRLRVVSANPDLVFSARSIQVSQDTAIVARRSTISTFSHYCTDLVNSSPGKLSGLGGHVGIEGRGSYLNRHRRTRRPPVLGPHRHPHEDDHLVRAWIERCRCMAEGGRDEDEAMPRDVIGRIVTAASSRTSKRAARRCCLADAASLAS